VEPPFTPRLAFPQQYRFDIRWRAGRYCILDQTRHRYVALTPEEWVRQNLIEYLVRDRGCPRTLIAVETGLDYHGKSFRADAIVHARDGSALLLAECKEPGTVLEQAVLEQVADYNAIVGARYVVVTNGQVHRCWQVDPQRGGRVLDALPRYERM